MCVTLYCDYHNYHNIEVDTAKVSVHNELVTVSDVFCVCSTSHGTVCCVLLL